MIHWMKCLSVFGVSENILEYVNPCKNLISIGNLAAGRNVKLLTEGKPHVDAWASVWKIGLYRKNTHWSTYYSIMANDT